MASHDEVFLALRAAGYEGQIGEMLAAWKLDNPLVPWDELGGDKYVGLDWLTP